MQAISRNTGITQNNITFGAKKSIQTSIQLAVNLINKGENSSNDKQIMKGLAQIFDTGAACGVLGKNRQMELGNKDEILRSLVRSLQDAVNSVKIGIKLSDDSTLKVGIAKVFELGESFGHYTRIFLHKKN